MNRIISNIAVLIMIAMVCFSGHFDSIFAPRQGDETKAQQEELLGDQEVIALCAQESDAIALWKSKFIELNQAFEGLLITDAECADTIGDNPIRALFSNAKIPQGSLQKYHKLTRTKGHNKEH